MFRPSIRCAVLMWELLTIIWQVNCTLGNDMGICEEEGKPKKIHEQVHLAYGDTVDSAVVTWSTMKKLNGSLPTVKYGINGTNEVKTGYSDLFVDGGKSKRSQYIHRVPIGPLKRDTVYTYVCGNKESGWSEQFSFKTPPKDETWQPHISIYGDMGLYNARALPRLLTENQKRMYDAIFHIGDFAYNMDQYNGRQGDAFMNRIEPIAANIPYMTCVGNHEAAYNFSHYRYRFSMPGLKGVEGQLFYSINIGPMHIISINTEVYYHVYNKKHLAPVATQYQWLEKDLIKANLPQNRKKQPWILVVGHRPMYCSDDDGDDCDKNNLKTRIGLKNYGYAYGMEKLFYDYGVDLEIWAHEHTYERLWPVYDSNVYNGSYSHPYTNPKAPVHFTSGSAGCVENTDRFFNETAKWSAFRSRDYGTARIKAYNGSHIHVEQVSDNKKGAIIDSFWMIKDTHGFYPLSDMTVEKIKEKCLKTFDETEQADVGFCA